MTDSLLDAQSTEAPASSTLTWELAAPSMAYPVTVQSGRKFFEIYVHLKPYPADVLISILNSVPGGVRRETQTVKTSAADFSKFARLTDECFVRMENTSMDDNPAAQKAWLDQNPQLKVRIARDSFGGVDEIDSEFSAGVPASEHERLELLPEALNCSETQTPAVQEMWDPNRKIKTKIRMLHTLRAETEQDWRKWSRTGNETFNKATKESRSSVNWWARAELYDSMVQRIDGMTINGAPCTAANKAAWLPLVPVWHKFMVIASVFDELRVKNG